MNDDPLINGSIERKPSIETKKSAFVPVNVPRECHARGQEIAEANDISQGKLHDIALRLLDEHLSFAAAVQIPELVVAIRDLQETARALLVQGEIIEQLCLERAAIEMAVDAANQQ